MQANPQYFVKTKDGSKLELSKGAYLTLLRRKTGDRKTLKKTKKIARMSHDWNKTVKKNKLIESPNVIKSKVNQQSAVQSVVFHKATENQTKWRQFEVFEDQHIFSMQSIPNIDMEWDNDEESDWFEVDDGIKRMTNFLSTTVLDSPQNF